jgi:hypothetical protein
MKMKLETAVKAAQVVARLNSIRMKSPATARKLFSLKQLLEPNFEFYANEEQKMIDDLGGAVAEDGSILFADQPAGIQKLSEGRKELLETEVDVPIDTPIIFHDSEGIQVSGDEIGILEGLAEFKE